MGTHTQVMYEFFAVRDHEGTPLRRVRLLRGLKGEELVDLLSDPEQAVVARKHPHPEKQGLSVSSAFPQRGVPSAGGGG